jgi:hypothetical protein
VFTLNVDTVVRLPGLESSGLGHRARHPPRRPTHRVGQPVARTATGTAVGGGHLVPLLWRRIIAEGRTAMVIVTGPR